MAGSLDFDVVMICIIFIMLTNMLMFLLFRTAIAKWDLDETKHGGPFKEILKYDILVNCILLTEVQCFTMRS